MKNISIFLSSTFNDMQSERDLMRDTVAPELEDALKVYGRNVEFIDLRWGIDTQNVDENEANRKILKTCFDEIRGAEPFFIAFLGERYGWIPDRDDVLNAFADEGLDGMNADGKSVTALEIECAKRLYPVMDRTLFYFRDDVDYGDDTLARDMFVSTGEERKKLKAQKAELKRSYPDRVHTYSAVWNSAERRLELPATLKASVIGDVLRIIESDAALCEKPTGRTQESVLVTDNSIARLARSFSGRLAEKQRIAEFIRSDKRMLALVGESGSGKSSLLASVAAEHASDGDTVILPFFTGADEHSGTAESMMRAAVFRARQAMNESTDGVDDLHGTALFGEFNESVNRLAENRRVLLIADALNQLSHTEYEDKLKWFDPYALSPSVKVIVSVTSDYSRLSFIRSLGAVVMNVDNFAPEDALTVSDRFFAVNHKQANPRLLAAIGARARTDDAFRSPIYLLNLLQQLNNIGGEDFKKIKAIESEAGESAADAIVGYLVRTVMNAPDSLNEQLDGLLARAIEKAGDEVKTFAAAIAVSRFGMTERLMSDICKSMGVRYDGASFSYFRRLFKTDLIKRENGAWDFSHALVKSRYAATATAEQKRRILSAVADSLSAHDDGNEIKRVELGYYLAATDRLEEFASFFARTSGDPTVENSLVELLREPNNFDKTDKLFVEPTIREFVTQAIARGEFSAELAEKYGHKILCAVYAHNDYPHDRSLLLTVANVYRALGGIAYSFGYFATARDYYMLELKVSQKIAVSLAKVYSALADCYFALGREITCGIYRKKAMHAIENEIDFAESDRNGKSDGLLAAYYAECDRLSNGALVRKKKTIAVINKLKALADSCTDDNKRTAIYTHATVAAARIGATPDVFDPAPLERSCETCTQRNKIEALYSLALFYADTNIKRAVELAVAAREQAELALKRSSDVQILVTLDKVLDFLRMFDDNAELDAAHEGCLNRLTLLAPSYDFANRYIAIAKKSGDNAEAIKAAENVRKMTARSIVTAEQKTVNKIMLLLACGVLTAFLFVMPLVFSLFRGIVQNENSRTPYGIFVNFYIPAACETLIVMMLTFLLYAVMQLVRPSNDYAARRLWFKRGIVFLILAVPAFGLYGLAWSYFGNTGIVAFDGAFWGTGVRYVALLTSEMFALVLIANEIVNFIMREIRTASAAVNAKRFICDGKKLMLDYVVNGVMALSVFGVMIGSESWFKAKNGMMLFFGFEMFYAICATLAAVFVAKLIYLTVMRAVMRKRYGQNV